MSKRSTPETDELIRTQLAKDGMTPSVLSAKLTLKCESLERERDDARKELEEYRSIAENIGAKKAVSEKEKAIRERDEAREKYTTLLTDNMLDVHKLYKAIELIKSLINQIERPAYGVDEAVAKMFLMEEAKKFANEMQQM